MASPCVAKSVMALASTETSCASTPPPPLRCVAPLQHAIDRFLQDAIVGRKWMDHAHALPCERNHFDGLIGRNIVGRNLRAAARMRATSPTLELMKSSATINSP